MLTTVIYTSTYYNRGVDRYRSTTYSLSSLCRFVRVKSVRVFVFFVFFFLSILTNGARFRGRTS